MLKKILLKLDEHCSIYTLSKIIGFLLILFLIIKTESFWGSWLSLFQSILQPFVIGFILAFIMNPMVKYLQRKGVPRNLAIMGLWVLIIIFMVILLVMLMPILYDKTSEFMASMIDGVMWISDKIKVVGKLNDFSLVNSITDNIVKLIESYDNWMPQVISSLPGLMTTFLDITTNVLFSIIVAIYMLFDFDRIKTGIIRIFRFFIPESPLYLHRMNVDVSVYLKSLIILMVIKFFEYCAFYFLVGHRAWLIIGILTSLGVIVPYLGGTIANGIGIITGLTLAPQRIAALLIGILILSNVDAYVISPLVHEKRSSLGPLSTLFAVFAGGVLIGPFGIMIAVPVMIIVKTSLELYQEQHEDSIFTSSE
ncbi:MAG: AI-2E family transporter [Longicatena sp.]